jgi:hypothetical protein
VSDRHPIRSQHPWRHRALARIHELLGHSVTFHGVRHLDGDEWVRWVECSCGWES